MNQNELNKTKTRGRRANALMTRTQNGKTVIAVFMFCQTFENGSRSLKSTMNVKSLAEAIIMQFQRPRLNNIRENTSIKGFFPPKGWQETYQLSQLNKH